MSDESTQEMLGTIRIERTAGAGEFARKLGPDLVERQQFHSPSLDTLRREVKEVIEAATEQLVRMRDTAEVSHAAVLSELGTLRQALDCNQAQRCSVSNALTAFERCQTELLASVTSIHQRLDVLALDVAAAARPPWWRRWFSGR
jgi:hypothetical protein